MIFLEETEDLKEENICVPKSPISLEYKTKCSKCLKLNWLQIPDDVIQIPDEELVDLDLDQDYRTVLNKLKEGILNVEDIVKKPKSKEEKQSSIKENVVKITDKEKSKNKGIKENKEVSENVEMNNRETEIKEFSSECLKENGKAIEGQSKVEPNSKKKYIKEAITKDTKSSTPTLEFQSKKSNFDSLLKLAKAPVKKLQSTDKILKASPNHLIDPEKTKDINILKQLYLQNLALKDIETNINLNQIDKHVNLENSIKEGILKRSNLKAPLSEEEKNALISIENIHNLSLPLQLAVLVTQLKVEKENLSSLKEEELREQDKYGRTAKDRYRILKSFAKDIWYLMFVKLKGS